MSVLPILSALALASGCAANWATTQPATGEPLSAEWKSTFRQGTTPIDEQDFYRIAGDRESYDQIAHERVKGMVVNRIGVVLAIAGIASLVAGATIDTKAYPGVVFMPIGGIMAYWGIYTAERRPHISIDHAQQAADRYNARVAR